jgi:hypothetical protein
MPKGSIPNTAQSSNGIDTNFQSWLKKMMEKRNA